jgi:DNA-binding CsgD family transcriptional regulator
VTVTLSSCELKGLESALELMVAPQYGAARENWLIGVMKALKLVLKADKAIVRSTFAGTPTLITKDYGTEVSSEYFEYFRRFDPGRALDRPPPRLNAVWTVEDAYGTDIGDFYKTEFFNDYQRRHRAFHGLCLSSSTAPGPLDDVMYFHRSRLSAAPFADREKNILRLCAPAFRAGLSAALRANSREHLIETIDNLTDGCALVTIGGRVVHQNVVLSSYLANGEATAELRSAIMATADAVNAIGWRATHCSAFDPGRKLVREQRVGDRTFVISGCSVGTLEGIAEPLTLVTVRHKIRQTAADLLRQARERFGLSNRESEVAVLLAQRKTNAEISSELGISPHTARHHSERVLAKLGVSKRSMVSHILHSDAR